MVREASPAKNILKKYAWIIIILLAIFLRTVYMNYNNIGHYIIPSMITALDIAEGKSFPLEGPVLGEFNAKHGPASYYLFALPILFDHNPLNIFFFIVLLNVISVYVVYRIGKDFFSVNAGLIAALIHAVQPNLVVFSRNITDDALVQIFVALIYYCFFSIISNNKTRLSWVVLPVAFALGMQLHFQLVVTLFFVVLLFLFFKPAVPQKQLGIGIAIALLCLSPQIWHDLTISNTHFLSFYYAGLDFLKNNVSIPDNQMNSRGNIFSNCLIVFGVLFYYYLAALVFVTAGMVREKVASGTWFNFENQKILSLLIFSIPSLLVFSNYGSQIFNRHHAAFTPMAILIGIALSGMFSTSLKGKKTYVRIPALFARSAVMLFFAGIILLYIVKSYGIALINVNPAPGKYFNVFGRFMCMDQYRNDCEEVLESDSVDFWQDTYYYRRKQFEIFFNDFGLDRKTLLANVHGMPYFRMFGDDGYLFRTLPQGKSTDAASFHYLIAEADTLKSFIDRMKIIKTVRLSSLVALKYKSYIDYSGLKYMDINDGQTIVSGPGDMQWINRAAPLMQLSDICCGHAFFGVFQHYILWLHESLEYPHWSRFERGVDRSINLGITDSSLDTTNHYHWIRAWNQGGKIVKGSIGEPDDFSSMLLVVEVLFKDIRETLVGPGRDVEIHLYFNNKEIQTAEVGYSGNIFFGESYRHYYIIDKKYFGDSNAFTFTINDPHTEERYAIDVYGIALKD